MSGSERIKVKMARGIPDDSWLNEDRFAWFREGYFYAATQTRAIPALSDCDPHDLYFAVSAILRGAGLGDPELPRDAP